MKHNTMEICYLLAFPDAAKITPQTTEQIKGLKDAPYFQPIDIDVVTLGDETIVIEDYAVSVGRQRYDGRIQMVECHYELSHPFAASVLPNRTKIQSALQSRYIPETIRKSGLFEEYTILLVQDVRPTPDKWIEKNSFAIANFIRSQREVFDKEEANDILISRARYSASDLTLVDWEGGVIIAPNADYQSDIALLKIGNYQLLRYRMLDQSIEEMLDKINERFFQAKRPRATRGLIRQIAEHRLVVAFHARAKRLYALSLDGLRALGNALLDPLVLDLYFRLALNVRHHALVKLRGVFFKKGGVV